MKVEGEPGKRFRVSRTDINSDPFECEGEYDTIAEVRAHRYRADRRYKISVTRKFMTRTEFEAWARMNDSADPSFKQ
jgi:hypothetical protein